MPKSQFSEAYDVFRQAIIDARLKQNVTQVQLGKLLRKPQSWVSAYETGLRRLDVIEFVAIARALNVDSTRLFREVVVALPRALDI